MTRAIPSTCRRCSMMKHPTNKRAHPLSRSACNGQRHRSLTSQQARTTTVADATNGLICNHGRRRGGRVPMETNEGERCRKRALHQSWPREPPASSLRAGLREPPPLSPRRWGPGRTARQGAGAKRHGKARQVARQGRRRNTVGHARGRGAATKAWARS